MTSQELKRVICILGLFMMVGTRERALAAEPDWKAVESALGKSGQIQPGGVFRIGMPRTDLTVTVKGVPVKAGFALGSYAAFKSVGDHTMVMGDLVLLESEINPVLSKLEDNGIEISAIHNHILNEQPRVMYMHYMGHGDEEKLARAMKDALALSATPMGAPPPSSRQSATRRPHSARTRR